MTRDDPAAFAPPPAFGPFRVLHQIGIGALGPVFRTYDPARDRLVAVKVFRLDITPEQALALADELAAAANAGLFHPSIVEPIAAGVQGTVAYRAEEYVAAESLDVAMRHYAPASLEKALPFLTQLAGAIDFARTAGVGHGALHLRDVFVTPDEARASGFGIVEALERMRIRAPVRRPYSAPERIAGAAWSTPADVFSLAAIAFELLTGRRPAGTGAAIGAVAADIVGDYASAVHAVLARAMDDDPERRYPSALAFASALEAAARGSQVTDTVLAVGAISSTSASAAATESAAIAAAAATGAVDAMHAESEIGAEQGLDVIARLESEEPVDAHPPSAAGADSAVITDDEDGDVAAERDADAAHHDLLQREREDDPEPTLFDDDEAAADLAFSAAASRDFSLDALDKPNRRRASASIGGADEDDGDATISDRDAFTLRSATQTASASTPSNGNEFAEEDNGRPPSTPAWDDEDTAHAVRALEDAGPYVDSREEGSGPMEDAHGLSTERPRPAMLPLAVTLVFGLLAGFAVGYAVGGRAPDNESADALQSAAAAPAPAAARPQEPGKAYSEQTVASPPTAVPPVPGDGPAPLGSESAPPARSAAAATTGRIVVLSTPANAGVIVNGKWRGRTPLTVSALKFGTYAVRIVQPGYAVAQKDVTLTSAEPSSNMAFRLARPATRQADAAAPARTPGSAPAPRAGGAARFVGAIYVDSRPRGARVLVDGRAVGTTPARIADIPAGSHAVRLELADHHPWTTSTRVAAGQEARVTGSLERIR